MTELLDTLIARPEPKRDRYGRYLLPDPSQPGTGPARAWTRVTTFAKSISDTFGLSRWQTRMAVKGVTMRPDLFALAASATADDKATLDKVAEQAKEAAGTSTAANGGTALHAFTERADRGEQLAVPAPWDADLAAYQQALARAGIRVLPELIERIVVLRGLGLAGTFDRIVRLPDGRLAIADLKTGRDLSYGWLEIAIQLACYSRADAVWNAVAGVYEPMPPVDQHTGVVMHLPASRGVCVFYEVDLDAGWEAAQLCAQVRAWRARRNLATPMQLPTPRSEKPVDVPGAATDLAQRIDAAESVDQLIALFEAADAAGRWTDHLTVRAAARKKHLLTRP